MALFLDMEPEWKNFLKLSYLYEVEVWGLKFSIKIVKKRYLITKSLGSEVLPSANHSSKGLVSLFFSVSSIFSTLLSSLTSLVSLGFFKSGKDLIYVIFLNLNRVSNFSCRHQLSNEITFGGLEWKLGGVRLRFPKWIDLANGFFIKLFLNFASAILSMTTVPHHIILIRIGQNIWIFGAFVIKVESKSIKCSP